MIAIFILNIQRWGRDQISIVNNSNMFFWIFKITSIFMVNIFRPKHKFGINCTSIHVWVLCNCGPKFMRVWWVCTLESKLICTQVIENCGQCPCLLYFILSSLSSSNNLIKHRCRLLVASCLYMEDGEGAPNERKSATELFFPLHLN